LPAKLQVRVEEQSMLRFAKCTDLRALRPGILAIMVGLTGCAVYAEPVPVYHGGGAVHVPPGHLPPPGACRVWYPDRPPGHQPPPGPCHELQYQVPPGAVLVQG
jgi:hypothetical protein